MTVFGQIAAVTGMNLRNLPQRLGPSIVVVAGTAGVVAVLISVLAMGVGFARTVEGAGRADRVIVLSDGALNESGSNISRDEVTRIITAPGIRHDAAGDSIANAELLVQFQVPRKGDAKPVNVPLRGVGKSPFLLRSEIHLVQGRMFQSGLHELLIGRTAAEQYSGLGINQHLKFQGGDWTVVGIFETVGASSMDSGAMGDAQTLMTAFRRNSFNSVTALLDGPGSFDQLKAALGADLALHVTVDRESTFFASQSRSLNIVLNFIGYFVGGMMAVGAIFCALNTMYAAVSARSREIATLRAVGFRAGAVVISVVSEALVLALIGALAGALIAWLVFDGHLASMAAGGGGTQLAFALQVTPDLIILGVIWACFIGLIGGTFPGIRATRMPIAKALNSMEGR
jgi:putative ABC transport system permease protein